MADFYPAASTDDSHIRHYSTVKVLTSDLEYLQFGDYTGDKYHLYLRFPNVTIPQGATIISAVLELVEYQTMTSTGVKMNIYANNVDNASPPADGTAYLALDLTSEVVAWDISSTWTQDVAYQSPDIADVIQAIVSREGWASGNALALCIKDNESSYSHRRTVYAYDSGGSYPKLTISYTVSGTTSTGDASLPLPNVTAGCDGVNSSLPLLSAINCYVEVPYCELDEALPLLTVSATGITGVVNVGDCELPLFTISATAGSETTGAVDLELPILSVLAAAITGEIHAGVCDLPPLLTSSIHKTGTISRGICPLPLFLFTARTINTGVLSQVIPCLTIDAYAHGPLVSTADLQLPFLQVIAALLHESEAIRCYVLNTENNAISEYDNFPFNSFCTFKGKHLAAGANGITLLEGNKDNSTDINAYLNVGNNDFDLSSIKRITDAYLSMKGDGSYYLTVTSDDGTPHSYLLSATTGDRIKNLKTNVGKGKKGRFFELELSNLAGADFELYDMVLNVELLKRNI